VGDLLTFPINPVAAVLGGLGPRRGLHRGTSATSWYELGCRLEGGEGRGEARRELRDVRGAQAAYERAIAGCPTFADAHNNLGRLHHDAGSLAVAESCYRLAICADAAIALYWFNLGVVVEDQGRHAEAIAAYEQALAIDPHAADVHYNLARLFELSGRRVGDAGVMRSAVRHLLRYRQLTKRNAGVR
jgi:tetratricopeptide (TPR) repeat protein